MGDESQETVGLHCYIPTFDGLGLKQVLRGEKLATDCLMLGMVCFYDDVGTGHIYLR
jgi:hypothetical protein